jgi:hypothetical protein
MARRSLVFFAFALAPCVSAPSGLGADGAQGIALEGYAEWRQGANLVVDGQRVRAAAKLRFKGAGDARDFRSIPLGYEVKVQGVRLADGTVLAREVEAKPNGDALFEGDLKQAFNETEAEYRRKHKVFEQGENGNVEEIGRLLERGPEVDRVRAITDGLVPPYRSRDDFRVYVVANKEWNAMAAPNGAIFVFSGLLQDLDDDEVAIVLGHELVHATHEHSRKGFKKQLVWMIPTLLVVAAAEGIDSDVKRGAVQIGALIAGMAINNGYGRAYEDQADRVGLRYAHEGGYDVEKGPRLWNRFAQKYGGGNKLVNFFFSDHATSRARAVNLERELLLNYR